MPSVNFNLLKIFVEGSTDQAFIQFFLETRFGIFLPEKALSDAIIDCKGKDNLAEKLRLQDTALRKAEGGINLILFDADSARNAGGFHKRKQEIASVANTVGVPSYIYLFPDNQRDGDLEAFYCSCFRPEMAFFGTCWDNMINCLEAGGKDLKLHLPKAAEKVFSYVDLFRDYKSEEYQNIKTKRSYFDPQLWHYDFESNPYLISLQKFLEPHLAAPVL